MPTIHSLCLLLTLILGASAPPSDTALEQILHQQEAAWNIGDGPAWSSSFTDDADFINIRGDLFHGREDIGRRHAFILGGPFKGSHLTITLRSITEPAPNVAIIETEHEVTNFKSLPPGIVPTFPGVLKTRMKYVAVKQGDQWHFIAAQNTAILPVPPIPPH